MDGWRAAELKALPPPILARLAELLNTVEATGDWPQSLERATVSLIPKGDGCRPRDMRPISVTSIIYRLWAAARLSDLKDWQESWASTGQHGFRQRHGPEDVYWAVALHLEAALLNGDPILGVNFDYTKCFDLIPHGLLFRLLVCCSGCWSQWGCLSVSSCRRRRCTESYDADSAAQGILAPNSLRRMVCYKAALYLSFSLTP
jgi:hypothetical protein